MRNANLSVSNLKGILKSRVACNMRKMSGVVSFYRATQKPMKPRARFIKVILLPVPVGILLSTANICMSQHDRERNALRYLAEGKIAEAYHELKHGKNSSGPAEEGFLATLCLLREGKTKKAYATARQAVRDGLPFERLLAEPRQWLAPLRRDSDFRKWKALVQPSSLVHGPMIGQVTDSSAVFWFRTDGSRKVAIEIIGHSNRRTFQTKREEDFIGFVKMVDLLPETYFSYRVFIDGVETKIPGVEFGFRTFPREWEGSKFVLAFGGCSGFVPEFEKTWSKIADHEPRAMLMLGDNVYIDDPEEVEWTGNYCYSRRHSRPEWRKLVGATSMHAIYDDHDFGTDDCIPGSLIDEPIWKRSALANFSKNWNNPAMGEGEKNPGCWHTFTLGRVQVILLDCRYYRDQEENSMLGTVQKAWLKKTLVNSSAVFKIVASSVPFSQGVKPGSMDPWDGYGEEREEIFSFIEEKKIEGVLLIAADRHRIDLRKTVRPQGYDLFEFVSGRLTNRHIHPVVKTEGLIWGYNESCGYGLLRFDTRVKNPSVVLESYDMEARKLFSFEIKASELTFNR